MSIFDKLKSFLGEERANEIVASAAVGYERGREIGNATFKEGFQNLGSELNKNTAESLAAGTGKGKEFIKSTLEHFQNSEMTEFYQNMVAKAHSDMKENIQTETAKLKPKSFLAEAAEIAVNGFGRAAEGINLDYASVGNEFKTPSDSPTITNGPGGRKI